MQDEVSHGGLHPMKAKKDLAWGIVRDFHSAAEADAAAENWAKQFQQRAVSEDVPVVKISLATEGIGGGGEGRGAAAEAAAVGGAGGFGGRGDAKIGENAVSVNGEKYSRQVLRGVKCGRIGASCGWARRA